MDISSSAFFPENQTVPAVCTVYALPDLGTLSGHSLLASPCDLLVSDSLALICKDAYDRADDGSHSADDQ